MKKQGITKEDIVKLVQEKGVKIINFCHIPEDCRLKTLSFTAKNKRARFLANPFTLMK
jgi:hypothetical protein